MLKYLKRQAKSLNKTQENDVINVNVSAVGVFSRSGSLDCGDSVIAATKRHSLRSTTSFCDEVFLAELAEAGAAATEDKTLSSTDAISCSGASLCNELACIGTSNTDEDIFKYNSRLSMTLATIVNEPNCLSYFVQYLDAKKALPMIKFYLDIENFKRVALIHSENLQEHEYLNEVDKQVDATTLAATNTATDTTDVISDEVNNDVPELKTLCDLSMRKPLTDDEKCQIYAETNKQINKCNNNNSSATCLQAHSELSLYSATSDSGCSGIIERAISAASIKDAMAIYQKYLILNARQFVELPITILTHISLLLCKSNDDDNKTGADAVRPIPATCFDEARDYVLQLIEREYVQEFLQSAYYCKYCIELIESQTRSINIYDVLYSEVTLFYFMEYLEQHHERTCLDFWSAAINFRKSFDSSGQTKELNISVAQADAMIIYERFFSLQAERRLWLSDKLRSHVEQYICGAALVAHAFDLPLQVTAKYLEQKYFIDFLKSKLFDNYLNELKMKIQMQENANTQIMTTITKAQTSELNSRRITKSQLQQWKTSSDVKHISQHNTLLATMDTVKPTTHTTNNMSIDSRYLTNPSLLWQRTRNKTDSKSNEGGLIFGRVTSLGRYERDFDVIDSANKSSWSFGMNSNKIKNAMRKLVNLPEDKVQEEIAWQVAEMIVKDVTNVTLNGDLQNNE